MNNKLAPCWNRSFSECLDQRTWLTFIVPLIVFLSELSGWTCRWQIVIQRREYSSTSEPAWISNIKKHSPPADVHCPFLSILTIKTRVHCSQKSCKWVLIMKHQLKQEESVWLTCQVTKQKSVLLALTWKTGRSRDYFILKSTRHFTRDLINMTLFPSRLIINSVFP